jgi:hypothetical protein
VVILRKPKAGTDGSAIVAWISLIMVIVMSNRHQRNLMSELSPLLPDYRTHLALAMGTFSDRQMVRDSDAGCGVISLQNLGGPHHRYKLAA